MNTRPPRLAVAWSIGIALAGCATHSVPPPRQPVEEAAALERLATDLLPATALEGELVVQQHVTVRWRERWEGFDAVLQKRDQQLLLVGLGPMDTVGFSLALEAGRVDFVNQSGRDMPFAPEHILADVQRIFYPWIDDAPDCTNCERNGTRAGLDIWERIGPEHLEERRFAIRGEPDRGQVVIRYEGWSDGEPVPARAILDNDWFGYQLTIDSLAVEATTGPTD